MGIKKFPDGHDSIAVRRLGKGLEHIRRGVTSIRSHRGCETHRPSEMEPIREDTKMEVVVVGEHDGRVGEHLPGRHEHRLDRFADS